MLQYLIVGTGRSGTGFMASLFNNNKLRCGHETILNEKNHGPKQYLKAIKKTNLIAESSWMAVPFLHRIVKQYPNTKLIQITRNPIKIIKSFKEIGFYTRSSPWLEIVKKYVTVDNDIDSTIRYILKWYELIEKHENRLILNIDDLDYDALSAYTGKKINSLNIIVNPKTKEKTKIYSYSEIQEMVSKSELYPELSDLAHKYNFTVG
jgi:hypothetical protein